MPPTRTVIRPHTRDQHLSPLPVDFNPGTIGWVLAEGARGNIALQNQLFNTMEDTWDRLRSDLNKLKQAVCKLPFNVQPWAEKGHEPSAEALEKAAFVEHVLHNQKAKTWEGQNNFHGTIYELLDAVARGISVLEIEWELSGGYYIPVGTRRVPWTCIGFEKTNYLSAAKGSKSANPNALRLYPDRDPGNPKRFEQYPHKFLVGIYKGKSGSIGETAQLRSLAHLWLGRMLGWEWTAQKAELFGIPVRWATYDPNASQDQIDAVTSMLENMGTAAWGAFPEGTKLEVIQGNLSGVAGSNEPNERLAFLADRACDLLFLGQTLTTIEGKTPPPMRSAMFTGKLNSTSTKTTPPTSSISSTTSSSPGLSNSIGETQKPCLSSTSNSTAPKKTIKWPSATSCSFRIWASPSLPSGSMNATKFPLPAPPKISITPTQMLIEIQTLTNPKTCTLQNNPPKIPLACMPIPRATRTSTTENQKPNPNLTT